MTGEEITAIWIDDRKEHKDDVINIMHKNDKLKIIFFDPSELEDNIANIALPDIFLIDDRFNKSKLKKKHRRGFSFAAEIREQASEIPIYMFSQVKEIKGIHGILAQATQSLTDDIFDYGEIQNRGHEILYYDALDYASIRGMRRGSQSALLNLLNPPKEEKDRISKALPSALKAGLAKKRSTEDSTGNAISFARWVKQIFLELPGFVLDDLYSAIKLGLKVDHFRSLSSIFSDAKYRGVFSRTLNEDKWWDISLKKILFDLAYEKNPDLDETDPRKVSKELFELDESNTPKCAVCEEDYPDTVGLLEDSEDIKEPVHYKCSFSHPDIKRELFFDEIRKFKYKED